MTITRFPFLLLVGLLVPLAALPLSAQEAPVLVDAGWLNEHLDEVTVVHVQYRAGDFEGGHIPGARPLLWSDFVDDAHPRSELREVQETARAFRAAGISNARPVVFYGGHIPAARGFMTAEYLGHGRAHVLDGGLEAWTAAGYPTRSGAAGSHDPGDFEPAVRSEILVDADWILANLDSPDLTLIDARPDNEYRGEGDYGQDRGLAPGHIPGANQIFYREFVRSEDDPRYLDLGALADRFREANADQGDTVVSYCMVGMRASVAYLMSRRLGYDAKFYDGSWVDWSERDLPVVEGAEPGGSR